MSRTFRRMNGDNIAPLEKVRHGSDHPGHCGNRRLMDHEHPEYAMLFAKMHRDGNHYAWSVDPFFMRVERRKSRFKQNKVLRAAIRHNEMDDLVIEPMKNNRSRYY